MVYGIGYKLNQGEENERSIHVHRNSTASPSTSCRKRSRSARLKKSDEKEKGRELRARPPNKVRKTVLRKADRSKQDCRMPNRMPEVLDESEDEEETKGDEDEAENDKYHSGNDITTIIDDDEDDGPRNDKREKPIHFSALMKLQSVKEDVNDFDLIPLDFLYTCGVDNRLKLVPLESKMEIGTKKNKKIISKIIHIEKKDNFNRFNHLANINEYYTTTWEAGNDIKAKDLKKEIFQNPEQFYLVELSEKNETKINNKVASFQTDNNFKFMEIIRKDKKNCHTGKVFRSF